MAVLAGSATLLERASIGPGMRVLDAGCGPGRVTIPAAEMVGPTGEVLALDVQEAMLKSVRRRAAEKRLTNVRTLNAPLERGAVDAGAFDRALLVTVLGEIPDREGALSALHTALIVGGILSVTEVLPDPHYQGQGTVRRLAEGVGFQHMRTIGSRWAFTMNFRKAE